MRQSGAVSVPRLSASETGIRKGKRRPEKASAFPTCNGAFTIEILGYGWRELVKAGGGTTVLADAGWRRIAGFRVVAAWPDSGYAAPPVPPAKSLRARIAGMTGVLLLVAGAAAVGVALTSQVHAPQPSLVAAGAIGPAASRGPSLGRSEPVSVNIPAIGVDSHLLHLGVTSDGAMAVPSLTTSSELAAWYKYSVTPGQIGTSVIEGHVDNYQGPAIFFRLGALRPGDTVDVKLADGVTAIFRVTGVRQYLKADYPAKAIYGKTNYAALRLITCGGAFDYAIGHYLSSVIVFASLTSSKR
jgi:hypothetical protein